ncbi:MAG: Hsp70 family protein [Paludisphaera borealis]|uniref:Hsp70 family protein n=1 Tax=Paludisphaera borealis TaxID=1387353 RepID=UPI0028489E4E|nr:Hsp70 family protein [Paludisphaera borealis]MDR3622262.1 Hsp70 family protein [Paludisphaera borealis]
MAAFVGIDLGTTNSVVARRNAYGRPEVIANREGANITPSVIYFGVDPPVVGQEAKEWARLGDAEIASFFKPHMGSPLYQLEFHGKTYSAADLAAIVLKKLKDDAEAAIGDEIDRAVITVPAYFGDAQRKATIAAGNAAGLEVLRIINEPTAATLAYGLNKPGAEDETVLIYDLGGGTFDVTVARITADDIAVLATAGDHDLGGKNWDDRIATFLAEQFAAETGFDPLDDPVALNEVLVRSEQAKWALSERSSTRVTLQLGAQRKTYEISRDEFEAMTSPLMDRTRRLTEEALDEAGLSWHRLDGVLLVGGSTRMPMVRSYVTKTAGKAPRTGVNVDEVVALGAAVQAAMEAGQSIGDATPKFTLGGGGTGTATAARRVTDVMSHSLGVVAVNPEGTAYVNDVVIRRNVAIPAENVRSYIHATHGGANTRLEVYLTQGESPSPLDCTVLGKYVFTGIHPSDAEVKIDVGLSYDANGVVQVRATQRDSGHRLAMTVEAVLDDLSWMGEPPEMVAVGGPERIRVMLLMDVSSSIMGAPLVEAQTAAREFLDRCDFTTTEVGLISFSSVVNLQSPPTSNVRRLHAAIHRLEAEGSTNLTDALEMARGQLVADDWKRYVVILTDGFPDAPESAVEQAQGARGQGIDVVAIGTGAADREYLSRLASSEAASIFVKGGELVQTFGHIARVIAEGGRSLRVMNKV